MTTVGIIGGLGPESTARFYLTLQQQHAKMSQFCRIKTIIYSVPVPYILEQRMLLDNKAIAHYLPLLIKAAVALEEAGATLIVMPCNTLHCFIRQIQKAVSVKVLDMLALVSEHVQQAGFKRIGLLATSQTIASKIYHLIFMPGSVNIITPSKAIQGSLDSYIHGQVVHCNEPVQGQDRLQPLADGFSSLMDKEVDVVILGCTELADLADENLSVPVINSLTILSQAVISYVVSDVVLDEELTEY